MLSMAAKSPGYGCYTTYYVTCGVVNTTRGMWTFWACKMTSRLCALPRLGNNKELSQADPAPDSCGWELLFGETTGLQDVPKKTNQSAPHSTAVFWIYRSPVARFSHTGISYWSLWLARSRWLGYWWLDCDPWVHSNQLWLRNRFWLDQFQSFELGQNKTLKGLVVNRSQ